MTNCLGCTMSSADAQSMLLHSVQVMPCASVEDKDAFLKKVSDLIPDIDPESKEGRKTLLSALRAMSSRYIRTRDDTEQAGDEQWKIFHQACKELKEMFSKANKATRFAQMEPSSFSMMYACDGNQFILATCYDKYGTSNELLATPEQFEQFIIDVVRARLKDGHYYLDFMDTFGYGRGFVEEIRQGGIVLGANETTDLVKMVMDTTSGTDTTRRLMLENKSVFSTPLLVSTLFRPDVLEMLGQKSYAASTLLGTIMKRSTSVEYRGAIRDRLIAIMGADYDMASVFVSDDTNTASRRQQEDADGVWIPLATHMKRMVGLGDRDREGHITSLLDLYAAASTPHERKNIVREIYAFLVAAQDNQYERIEFDYISPYKTSENSGSYNFTNP